MAEMSKQSADTVADEDDPICPLCGDSECLGLIVHQIAVTRRTLLRMAENEERTDG